MSVHAEYMSAKYTHVAYTPEVNLFFAEDPGTAPVLVLSADEAVVIEGTHDELLALWRRIGTVLERGPEPLDPA
jgi:hypothetical protein